MNMIRAALSTALAAIMIAGCGGGTTYSSTPATASPTTSLSSTENAPAASATSSTTASPTTSSASASATNTSSFTSTTASLAGGFHLTSPAFGSGAAIPPAYTCDGNDVSPPLQFTGIPPGTRELVLTMRDPNAPSGNFVHWALAAIPPTTSSLPAGGVPGLVAPGRNSFGTLGYRGPCPPRGAAPHHYVLTLSALSSASGLRSGFAADQLQSTAIGIATLIGTYARR